MSIKITNLIFFIYSFEFLNVYLPQQMGRSKNTINSYIDTLTIFKRFIANEKGFSLKNFTFDNCTPEFIREFLQWLKEKGNCENTRNHRLAEIKSYLEYSSEKDISLNSIYIKVSQIKSYPVIKDEKPVLSETQFSSILSMALSTDKGKRNRVLLLLLYETAMRVSEIISLKLSNLHLERDKPYINVLGKGKKERNIPVSFDMALILNTFIKKYQKNKSEYLFFTLSKEKLVSLSPRSVQNILKIYSEQAREKDSSIPLHVYPHMLRRSKATMLYQNGMPIELVSSFLGHSQIETTRIYAKPSIEQMKKEIEKSLPQEAYNQQPVWKGKEDDFEAMLGLRS